MAMTWEKPNITAITMAALDPTTDMTPLTPHITATLPWLRCT